MSLRELVSGEDESTTADRKPLEEQVVVITGASSGIGLTTARMAADRGARVVLAAALGLGLVGVLYAGYRAFRRGAR